MPHIGPSRRWFQTAQSGGDLAIRDLVAAGLTEGGCWTSRHGSENAAS
jgi:hypothetical protein